MRHNLKLSRGQVTRLILILDEDINGSISLQEYYDALEAYGILTEKRIALDGSDHRLPFEQKALFKLLQVLEGRQMSPAELFRSCDVNDDGQVSVKELESVLGGLSPEFRQKDLHAIYNFFDIDKNGSCTEQEFMEQLVKAEKERESYLQ